MCWNCICNLFICRSNYFFFYLSFISIYSLSINLIYSNIFIYSLTIHCFVSNKFDFIITWSSRKIWQVKSLYSSHLDFNVIKYDVDDKQSRLFAWNVIGICLLWMLKYPENFRCPVTAPWMSLRAGEYEKFPPISQCAASK